MAITTEYSRLILKRATTTGVTPTIPLTSEIDNTWLPTDIMVGEVFVNTADDKMWIRTNGGIVPISLSGISSENYYTTDAYLLPDTYTLAFDRTDASEAFTVDLSSLVSSGSTEDKNIRVGNPYGGGIIVGMNPVSGTSTELLIMSLETLETNVAWSNITGEGGGPSSGSEVGGTNNYDGMMNTNLIIAQSGHTESAASICRAYRGGGFSDWYLPSVLEMDIVARNGYALSRPFGSYSPPDGQCWTSTEMSYYQALGVRLWVNAGIEKGISAINKWYVHSTLGIRAFRKVIIYG